MVSINMSLLIFAFRYTIAEKVAEGLKISARKIWLDSTEQAITTFTTETHFSDYDYILGMGMYSGRDKGALRIETTCSSQFRGSKTNLQMLTIPYFLHSAPGIKLAKGIGNSYCNLVSYQLLSRSSHPNYTFIHIPKHFDPPHAADMLEWQLQHLVS